MPTTNTTTTITATVKDDNTVRPDERSENENTTAEDKDNVKLQCHHKTTGHIQKTQRIPIKKSHSRQPATYKQETERQRKDNTTRT